MPRISDSTLMRIIGVQVPASGLASLYLHIWCRNFVDDVQEGSSKSSWKNVHCEKPMHEFQGCFSSKQIYLLTQYFIDFFGKALPVLVV